jgi:hypothetical protein
MTRDQFHTWLTKLGKAWEDRDPQAAASLFSENVQYYESPFGQVCADWDEVLKLWLVVPHNQKDVEYQHEVVMGSDDFGLAHWKVSRTKIPSNEKELLDGVFLVSLNDQGLCTFFKQWRMSKTNEA